MKSLVLLHVLSGSSTAFQGPCSNIPPRHGPTATRRRVTSPRPSFFLPVADRGSRHRRRRSPLASSTDDDDGDISALDSTAAINSLLSSLGLPPLDPSTPLREAQDYAWAAVESLGEEEDEDEDEDLAALAEELGRAPPPPVPREAEGEPRDAPDPRDGAELLSLPLPDASASDAPALAAFLEEWARAFERPGSGLTTAVRVRRPPGPASAPLLVLEFVAAGDGGGYADKDADADEGWETAKKEGKKREGGIAVFVEQQTESTTAALRIRLVRCNMSEGTVVKEMSEETIVERLKVDARIWRKSR